MQEAPEVPTPDEPVADSGICLSRRAAAIALMMASAVSLLACAKPPAPPKPKALVVDLQASGSVNPDARGRPSPIVVRVYELKSTASFESADFVALYEKDQAVLGADMVTRDEFVLSPGETRSIRREAGESKFLAVTAAFRDLERARWRAVTPLAMGSDNAFAIRLDGSALQITQR